LKKKNIKPKKKFLKVRHDVPELQVPQKDKHVETVDPVI
jgi:hypothetical protein